MSLEFNKVVDQIEKLGRMLRELDFDVSDRLTIARQRFFGATNLDAIHERIRLVRRPDVSGYRGAAPLDPPYHERICDTFPPPAPVSSATIMAADGSQIYPNDLWRVPYYLINTGLFVYYQGDERTPLQRTAPRLVYHPQRTREKSNRVLGSRTIDAMRTAREMAELGKLAWELKDEARPLVALYDNRLLFWVTSDVTGGKRIMEQYRGSLVHLHDARAILAGYVDNPARSRLIIRLLHLMSLPLDQIKTSELGSGDLEGLRDVDLLLSVLKPGYRTALMVQNSPHNLKYRRFGENYEIAFFYLRVTSGYQDAIARIDVPMWVARDKQAIDELHALLLEQCAMQGRNPYPYALTRADELAVVSSRDKAKLEEMIRLAWRLNRPEVDPLVFSAKQIGKDLARSNKRMHEL